MTEISVADERLAQVETLQKLLAEIARRAKDQPQLLPTINNGLQAVIDGKSFTLPAVHPAGSDDPYAAYRSIKGLIFAGPKEWGKAMTSRNRKNPNPLELAPDWCPQPSIEINGKNFGVDAAKELVQICRAPEWKTTPILWLALPEVAGAQTSLVYQSVWWGAKHDGFGPGNIRDDIFRSNFFCPRSDCPWSREPAVTKPTWMVGYESPFWTTSKDYRFQQEKAVEFGMSVSAVAQDALMLNLVLAATGKRLRLTTWSRTSTICGGRPLSVLGSAYGVCVFRPCNPLSAVLGIALSVHGVPLGL